MIFNKFFSVFSYFFLNFLEDSFKFLYNFQLILTFYFIKIIIIFINNIPKHILFYPRPQTKTHNFLHQHVHTYVS